MTLPTGRAFKYARVIRALTNIIRFKSGIVVQNFVRRAARRQRADDHTYGYSRSPSVRLALLHGRIDRHPIELALAPTAVQFVAGVKARVDKSGFRVFKEIVAVCFIQINIFLFFIVYS